MAFFFLQPFALVTPLFFQVVMDRRRCTGALTVVGVRLLTVSFFEALLSGLRAYVFSRPAGRVDLKLGTRPFPHLLALPLPDSETRWVEDAVARVRPLERVRQFLTGSALTVLRDLVFSVALTAVMLSWSA